MACGAGATSWSPTKIRRTISSIRSVSFTICRLNITWARIARRISLRWIWWWRLPPAASQRISPGRQGGEYSRHHRDPALRQRCDARILAVTGTKGKSTTTEMLGRMLNRRYKTWVGGNIGKSLLGELPEHCRRRSGRAGIIQLYAGSISARRAGRRTVALVTMISADHLLVARLDGCLRAGEKISCFQTADDYSVLNEHDPSRPGCRAKPARKSSSTARTIASCSTFACSGHNQLNAEGEFAAAGIFGIDWEDAGLADDFEGLPHRLELVAEIDGVQYINDSIATIPDAAVAALGSFPAKKVIQIIGGEDKKLPITDMYAARQAHQGGPMHWQNRRKRCGTVLSNPQAKTPRRSINAATWPPR